MLSKLDIINDMLASTGTTPLTSKDSNHPFYVRANKKLQAVSVSVQAMGWWFNRGVTDLIPNTAGEIILPALTLRADPVDTGDRLVVRGRKFYDPDRRSYKIGRGVRVTLLDQVDIEDMPPAAADYIRARSVYEYYRDAEGSGGKLSAYQAETTRTLYLLRQEELRNADVNWFRAKSRLDLHYRNPRQRLPVQER